MNGRLTRAECPLADYRNQKNGAGHLGGRLVDQDGAHCLKLQWCPAKSLSVVAARQTVKTTDASAVKQIYLAFYCTSVTESVLENSSRKKNLFKKDSKYVYVNFSMENAYRSRRIYS